jgi:fatty acid desaturase
MAGKINWYRTPLNRDLLKRLTRRSDLRGLLQAGSFLLIYGASVYLTLFFFLRSLWIPMIAAAYLHCAFHGFLGMEAAAHELSHGTPFKSKGLNEFFYKLFCFLTWNNPLHFRISHRLHHQYTVHRGLDKEVVIEPISFTLLDYLSWFLFDFRKFKMFIFTNIAHAFGRTEVDYFFWDPLLPPDDRRNRQIRNWARFVLIGHLFLLAVFIYFRLWPLIVVVTFGSFFATFLSRGCGIQQHLGLRPGVPDWRVSCHTVKFGPLMSYLYWRMNYHIEHHMYAAVPFFNLPRLHDAISFDTPKSVGGFLRGIGRILQIQKRQRKDPGYTYTPEFPPTAASPRLRSG